MAEEPAPVVQPDEQAPESAVAEPEPKAAVAPAPSVAPGHEAVSLSDDDIEALREMLGAFRAIKHLFHGTFDTDLRRHEPTLNSSIGMHIV